MSRVIGYELPRLHPAPTAVDSRRGPDQARHNWHGRHIQHSWYKAADGNVYIVCPWRLVDYWQMTARTDPADHLIL